MAENKIKPTVFNIENDQDATLLKAINDSNENFSLITKLYWAKKLNVKFKPTKCGAKAK